MSETEFHLIGDENDRIQHLLDKGQPNEDKEREGKDDDEEDDSDVTG